MGVYKKDHSSNRKKCLINGGYKYGSIRTLKKIK